MATENENFTRLLHRSGKPALSTYGVWQVLGADDNPDMGGSHIQPTIGFFEGTFEDVARAVLDDSRMYSWGGMGGELKKINIMKVDGTTIRKIQALKAEREKLESQLEALEYEEKQLGIKP